MSEVDIFPSGINTSQDGHDSSYDFGSLDFGHHKDNCSFLPSNINQRSNSVSPKTDLVKMEAENEEQLQVLDGPYPLNQESVQVNPEKIEVGEDESPPKLVPEGVCDAHAINHQGPSGGNRDVVIPGLFDSVKRALGISLDPQTPRLMIDDKRQVDSDLIQPYCLQSPIAIIEGLIPAGKLNMHPFTSRSLSRTRPNLPVELLDQRVQNRGENVDLTGRKTWKLASVPKTKKSTLKKYANYQGDMLNKYMKQLQKPRGSCSSTRSQKSRVVQRQDVSKTIDCALSIDLSDRNLWKDLHCELDMLSSMVRPNSPNNMISFLGATPVQLSMSVTGSRVAGREDPDNFCSVNFNIGPNNCEWFVVAKEYGARLYSMLARNGVDQDSPWWPEREALKAAGIPVYRCVQQPRELVWINMGTIFWSEALGITNNLTWRVGPIVTEQFQQAVIKYDENRLQKVKSPVPMTRLAWNMAKNVTTFNEHELFNSVKLQMTQSMADCVNALVAIKAKGIPVRQETDDETENCKDCQAELFGVFFRSTRKLEAGESGKVNVYCLECAEKQNGGLKEMTGVKQIDILNDLIPILEELKF